MCFRALTDLEAVLHAGSKSSATFMRDVELKFVGGSELFGKQETAESIAAV